MQPVSFCAILRVSSSRLGFVAGGLLLLLAAAPFFCVASRAATPEQAGTSRPVESKASPELFATLCALHAAGFEEDAGTSGWHPARVRLRSELLKLQGPATQALRAYYRDHALADRSATLSRYISFALVVGPPPDFKYLMGHDDLPPDVLAIEDFPAVLADFYREAQIDRLWAQVQPEYNREITRLHEPVTQIVMVSNGYLRELLRSTSARSFTVYVEPLIGAKTNFRSYGNRYAIVVDPAREIPGDEIRHAYLHFLLDPLPWRHGSLVSSKRPLLQIAARAPRLPDDYREDFTAFFTECLVCAVELRLRRLSPEKLAFAIEGAEADGYILVRAISRELAKFEKAEPSMTLYFPDLVRGIDVAQESKRLQGVKFAPAVMAENSASGAQPAGGAASDDSEIASLLNEGDRQIAAENGPAAAAAFERVLAKRPDHPRATYGLAVAAILEKDPEKAKELFRRLVAKPATSEASTAPDPVILAWSHIYLGRIYDVDGNRELAISEYRAALGIAGAPETARLAAQRGLAKGYEPVSRP